MAFNVLKLFRKKTGVKVKTLSPERPGVKEAPASLDASLGGPTPGVEDGGGVKERGRSSIASLILISPHISEKAAALQGVYVFKVSRNANKISLKKALEDRYGINVQSINVLNSRAKKRRRGMTLGHKPGYKKAIITLKEGDVINEY